ncbi:hypothetical protein N7492_005739 [Penicillium capsulatum]|uniref:Zn(2)-C6 fungal-type domain-containing protein n=1 Tax=Penicillium capsulatum TaxID=69766 RepID=A0A9W9ICZ6_9EURO|nr:hypothetical protein N7492_005739 [Penicillium capsulatum]KAJ6135162.1 hypothetical protein N7512_000322 [Penicillium capsulatum]
MPGVPTGRACDGCRKQKKKCDEKQPSCSRCARLKIPCIGSGQLRFKFQADKRSAKPTKADQIVARVDQRQPPRQHHFIVSLPPGSPTGLPGNALTQLASAFTHSIKRSTDLRFNLWWSFGSFLEDVPRRLGTNEALDRAVDTVTTAHANFCVGRVGSVDALAKYVQALRTLRVYLKDPVHAQSTNTLCAVMILLVCQMFMGPTSRCWSGHAEGAAQILRVRQQFRPQDPFEQKLFLSLRGVVLFEGLFNDRIKLSPQEWDDLVRNDFDGSTPDGRILLNLSRAPGLMHRGRETLSTGVDQTGVRDEVWSVYQTCKMNLSAIKLRLDENKDPTLEITGLSPTQKSFVRQAAYSNYQRMYGIGLVITLFFNCMLGALGAHDEMTVFDGTYLAEEVLALAEASRAYRPIGAGYLLVALTVAWAAVPDPDLRDRIMVVLKDYHGDFKIRDSGCMIQELEGITEHLRLGTPFRISGEKMAAEAQELELDKIGGLSPM